jgi:alkylation response protein AidB-like acyl-CoA dehydrogenase
VRALLDDETGHDPALWASLAELGWLAIRVPEEQGGMGASFTDLAVVLHELGRHLTPSPLLASLLGAEALLAGDNIALRDTWLPSIAAGEQIVTVAMSGHTGSSAPLGLGVEATPEGAGLRVSGSARFVPDAHVAQAVVVAVRSADDSVQIALVELPHDGVRITVEPTVDATRRLCAIEFTDVVVPESAIVSGPATGAAVLDRLTCIGAFASCVDALGAAEHMLEVSAAYAQERVQFGRPIGSFQAVKHHCANMLIAVEGARAAAAHAAEALDDPTGDVASAIAIAKSYGAPACAEACHTAVQVHGGIGFTWEHDAHLYLKRVKLDEALFGSVSWHRRRLAASVLAG